MDNKKTIIASIIGVALLVVLVVGATFAYFTTAVTNDDGETLVTGKTDAIGSIALTNPTSNLHITLSALDMAQSNLGAYYATNDSTKNYDTEEVQREIAVATLTGGEATTHYECTTTINLIRDPALMMVLQPGDAYIQFGGVLTDKVDLTSVQSSFPVTFKLNGTDTLRQSVSASFSIVNRNVNQNAIAGKNFTLKFSNDDLECKVVEGSGVAFAIYSETDNSLRFYKNDDEVKVGDTYNNLMVTAIYAGFEADVYTSHSELPWNEYREVIEKVVAEEKISPISTAYWFAGASALQKMDLVNLDTSNVTNMSHMFYNVASDSNAELVILGIASWDTSKVTDLSGMFDGYAVRNTFVNVDLSNWETSNVLDMSRMFAGISFDGSGSSFGDLSGWNTSNVTNMSEMFYDAILSYNSDNPLNLSSWNVSKVTDYGSFDECLEGVIIPPEFGTTS